MERSLRLGGCLIKERMSKCTKGAVIVNNARGAIVDTQAVADACSCGHIAGHAILQNKSLMIEAIAELDSLSEESYKDSTLIT